MPYGGFPSIIISNLIKDINLEGFFEHRCWVGIIEIWEVLVKYHGKE